ncbi:MAG: hypothetical protein ACI4JI_01775 [Ruminiclostridium sp.]
MSSKKLYEYAEFISLEKILPCKNFRIVPGEYKDIPGGISEVRVTIDVKKPFGDDLSFKVSASGRIYGWIRTQGDDILQSVGAKRIELIDWSDKFLMLIVVGGENKTAYYVDSNEVKNLLENCLRPRS